MAKLSKSIIDISGGLGEFVFKQYKYGTVVTRRPDMSRVKRSGMQKMKQSIFADAVAYAQNIIRDRARKKAWQQKLKKGETVYHAAIKDYMKKHKVKDPKRFLNVDKRN